MAANPSIQLGTDGNWAIKENNLLAYKKDGDRFFNKEFDFTRNTTATFVDENGLIASAASGVSRIDFTNNTKGHLLLEPQSTNLITYSEDFSDSSWIKSNVTMLSNQVISPDGTLNAFKTYPNSSGNYRSFKINQFNPVSGLHTFSIFAKAAELEHLVLIDYDGAGSGIDFNLSTGVATDNSTSGFDSFDMVDYGNGWYRCIATSTNGYYYWVLSNNGGVDVTANGTDGVYIFGGQVEALSYATSYIPTSGSAVTRNADVCNNSGSAQDFNSEEGVLYAEVSNLNGSGGGVISINTGNDTEKIFLHLLNNNTVRYYAKGSGGFIITDISISSASNFNKIAFKYKSSDFAVWINGFELSTDTSAITFSNFSSLDFYNPYLGGTSNFYGKTKALAVFKRALSDGELYLLTVTQYQSYQEMATALNYTL